MDFSEYFEYRDGCLIWKSKRPGRGCVVGSVAGTINSAGRRVVEIHGKKYLAYRIVWVMHHGSIPTGLCVDHIDGNKINDRIENLRIVTLSVNQRNSKIPKNNKTGIIGVTNKSGGFVVNCAGMYIGYFKDFLEACCARKSAERLMGFHANHGRK